MTRLIAILLTLATLCSAAHAQPPQRKFPTGARPSAAGPILAAPTFVAPQPPPAQFALVPAKLDMWGNDQFGDCVTAEEAFAKACYQPEIFIDTAEVVRWARRHRVLNGADLVSVMTAMQKAGFKAGPQLYNDGGFASVDYSNESTLQAAIASGPVKIAIDASALPSGAGNQQGWFAVGTGRYPNTDHCVSLCGYGPADFLYSQLGVPLPANLPASTRGYLLFTWSTIGFVDHAWLMSTCTEAWVRNPTTVGVPPLTPIPTPTPVPAPTPGTGLQFSEAVELVIAAAKPDLTAGQAKQIASFFADDNSPRVALLKSFAYHRALREGKIPAGTPIESVDWQGLIEFVQALMPLIEQMIVLFGGDEHAAVFSLPATLCAVQAEPTPAPKPAATVPPGYRRICTKNGCRLVPIKPTKSTLKFKLRAR